MTEWGVQVSVARTRAGVIGSRQPRERDVRDMLATVMDPELPMVSIVELGMVGAVTAGASIRVEVLPTYVGCPALEIIRATVADRLGQLGRPVEVVATFAIPWTAARITPAGSAALRAAGIRDADRRWRDGLPVLRL